MLFSHPVFSIPVIKLRAGPVSLRGTVHRFEFAGLYCQWRADWLNSSGDMALALDHNNGTFELERQKIFRQCSIIL